MIIVDIYRENKGRYGYRRITNELHNRGLNYNHKLVLKLMNELNLHGKTMKRKYNSYKGTIGKVAPNIIERNFNTMEPLKKLATDVSEFASQNGKVYLEPMIDMFNGEIISYAVSTHPSFSQTMNMLNYALQIIPKNNGTIIHSDQGWQYQMIMYQNKLKENGIIQSMSRKGNCLDNAMMENFFGVMKREMYYGHKYKTTHELIVAINEYIKYYNEKRIKSKLKMSPIEFRTHYQELLNRNV